MIDTTYLCAPRDGVDSRYIYLRLRGGEMALSLDDALELSRDLGQSVLRAHDETPLPPTTPPPISRAPVPRVSRPPRRSLDSSILEF